MAGWGKIRSCLIVGWVLTGIGLGTPSSDRRPLAGQPIALVGGMLIDGYGGPPLPDAVVLIEGNEIRAVGPVGSVSIPPDAYVIDTEGRTVLPGLMDMHVHLDILGHADYAYWFTKYRGRWLDLIMPIAARQLLMAGVTTVRDVGAELDSILEFKRRVERGQVPGPRLFVSGPFLQVAETISDYEKDFRWPVRDVTDARAKVRKLVEAGVDLIKLIDQDRMPQEVVNAIVDEAHRHGRHVTAHAHREGEILQGLQAGVDCFEHTGLATEPRYPDEVLRRIEQRNASLYWVPTLEGLYLYALTEQYPERLDDPRLKMTLPPDLYRDIRESLRNVRQLEYFVLTKRRIPTLKTKFQQLRDAGVTLLVGTDSGIPMNFHFDSTWRELYTWQQLGVPPMEAIRAATFWPARLLRRPDLGVIAPGKKADLIVVDGNPLEDLRDLRHVVTVIKDGRIYVEDGRWVPDLPKASGTGFHADKRHG